MQTIILQVLVFQLCFLVVYELLLRKETFFNWNRAYLLITSIASLLLPFIKLKSFSKVVPSDFFVYLPAVILGEEKVDSPAIIENLNTVAENTNSIKFSMFWIWYAGILVFSCVLFFKLYKIWRYKQSNSSVQKKGYSVTILKNSEDAFSFLKSIFLGDQIETTQKESILKHEKVHVTEKHTLDLLWFEVLRIVFWFNPLVYIYQKRITEVHEFIADKNASKNQHNYYENLLAKTFNIAQFSVVNQFYSSSLIKKRIIMLTKEKSNKTKLVKYITIIPIILSMLVYVSCTDALEIENTTEVVSNSETSVMEDILRLVYTTLPHDIKSEEISDEQFRSIITKLKEYLKNNEAKVEQTDLRKCMDYYLNARALNDPNKISEEEQVLSNFMIAEMYTSEIIRELNNTDNKGKLKSAICFLTKSKFYSKLEGINFKLANEAKWKSLYEDYLNNVKAGTVPSFEETGVPFTVLDQAPIFPGCDESATFEELKKCFSKGIAKHINTNFNTKIAKTHNLVGRQKIYIAFKVDEQGLLKEVKARGPHEALKTEAIRVINTLPVLKPGMHNGKAVTVAYSIPVIFEVN